MQFSWRDAIGKAGERAAEAFVEEELRFAYRRIVHPDIGVDGEIEILDPYRSSTGGFLKVQVKATQTLSSQKRIRVDIDQEHIRYFHSLSVQPILFFVEIDSKKIWWKPIVHNEIYRTKSGRYSIVLDTKDDRLTKNSARFLSLLGNRSNAIVAKYLIEEVEDALIEIDDEEAREIWDLVTAEHWATKVGFSERTLADAECLLRYERRYCDEIGAIESHFSKIFECLEIRKAWFVENKLEGLFEEYSKP